MNEILFFELGSAFDDLSKIFVALDLIVEDDRDFINMKNDIVKMCTDGLVPSGHLADLNNPLVPSTVDELNKKYAENIRKTIFKYKKIIVEHLEANECNLVPSLLN